MRFDDAITAFNRFTKEGKGKEENLKDAELQIQYCLNAKERLKYPLNATFENLGKTVNSEYNDYYPFIPLDESFIIYNSKRPLGDVEQKPNGEYPTVILISEVKDGKYQPAKKLELEFPKGTTSSEVIGLSANGNTILLYLNDNKGLGSIYISERVDGKYAKPVLLDKQINDQIVMKLPPLLARKEMLFILPATELVVWEEQIFMLVVKLLQVLGEWPKT